MAARKIAKRPVPKKNGPVVNGQVKGMGVIKPAPDVTEIRASSSWIFAPRIPCEQCMSPDINRCACPPPIKPISDEDRGKAVVAKMGSPNAIRCTFCDEWFDPHRSEGGHVGRWSASCGKSR